MNTDALNGTLYRVAGRVLEQLALMYLVAEDETPWASAEPEHTASVAFRGPFGGRLAVAVSDGLLPELAANMLGLPDAERPTPEQCEDALKELANVICGNLLPALAGTKPVFLIEAPRLGSQNAIEAASLVGTSRLYADAGVVDVRLFVDNPSALEAVA